MIYETFAYYYDKMMEDIDYDLFIELVRKYIPCDKHILDAGCGTGHVSIMLADLGYQVTALDISSDMLSILRHKMDVYDIHFPIYEADLCDPLPKNCFDAVVSFLDVINYIDDYELALKNIYETLSDQGIFIFDISTVSYFKELVGYHEEESFEDFSYKWNIKKGNDENAVVHHLSITNSLNKEFSETHYQKTYNEDVYYNYLLKLGFKRVIMESGFDNLKTFFICYK